MSNAKAMVLLAQLKGRGVELVVTDNHVSFRPATAVDADLRKRIAGLEPALLELLSGEKIAAKPPGGGATTEIRSVAPPSFSSCSTPPARIREIAPINTGVGGDRTYPCYCCGSREFWALARVRHWVCARCHAPDDPPREELVWLRLAATDSEPAIVSPTAAVEPGERVDVMAREPRTARPRKNTTAGQRLDPGTCKACGGQREVWGRVLRCTACWMVVSRNAEPAAGAIEPPRDGTRPSELFISRDSEWD